MEGQAKPIPQKSDEIIDKLYLSSQDTPMSIKNFRVIFKFEQKEGKYDLHNYKSAFTKNSIRKSDIKEIFDTIKGMEDCSYADMKFWTQKRLFLFIVCLVTFLMCINLYLLTFWQSDKDKKQRRRMKRIEVYLAKLNNDKYKKLGWKWTIGKWGGWLELSREVKEFMIEENKRLEHLKQKKNFSSENLNSLPIPIDQINTDINNDCTVTSEFSSPKRLRQNTKNSHQFSSNKDSNKFTDTPNNMIHYFSI